MLCLRTLNQIALNKMDPAANVHKSETFPKIAAMPSLPFRAALCLYHQPRHLNQMMGMIALSAITNSPNS
jgi:hypothetical protein